MAQIEHEDAVKNINEIFSVKGLNGYILGPYDLSASLGVPGDFDSESINQRLIESKMRQRIMMFLAACTS